MPSRTLLTLFTLSLLAAPAAPRLGAAQNAPEATLSAPDLRTPEAAIRSFLLAANAKDASGANCVVGGKTDPDLRAWVQDVRKTREVYRINVVSVQPQVDGDRATAAVGFEVSVDNRKKRMDETLSLQKAGAEWKIVPPTEAELRRYFKPAEHDPPLLAMFVAAYRYPRVFLETRDAAREADCQSNVQELAQGTLTYTQDFDDKFALRADAWKAAVEPYVKHLSAFRCISDENEQVAYSFNAQLQGKRVDAIRKPELTVLVYEGKKGVLNFRHHGRATVGFANGKVRSVTAAEARALRWAP